MRIMPDDLMAGHAEIDKAAVLEVLHLTMGDRWYMPADLAKRAASALGVASAVMLHEVAGLAFRLADDLSGPDAAHLLAQAWWGLRAARLTEAMTITAGWIVECRDAFARIDKLRVVQHDALGIVTPDELAKVGYIPVRPDEDDYPWHLRAPLPTNVGDVYALLPLPDGPVSPYVPPDEIDPTRCVGVLRTPPHLT